MDDGGRLGIHYEIQKERRNETRFVSVMLGSVGGG